MSKLIGCDGCGLVGKPESIEMGGVRGYRSVGIRNAKGEEVVAINHDETDFHLCRECTRLTLISLKPRYEARKILAQQRDSQ